MVENVLDIISQYGFPMVLAIYLVYKLDYFINEIIKNQKEFSLNITNEIKEIKIAIQQLRNEYNQRIL
jgi:hypothetical protein